MRVREWLRVQVRGGVWVGRRVWVRVRVRVSVRECSNFTLLHVAVQFSQHHLLKSASHFKSKSLTGSLLLNDMKNINGDLKRSHRFFDISLIRR